MNVNEDLEAAKRGAARLGECPGRLDMLEKLVGQPTDERTKPLFDIVAALNKEVMELRLKIEEKELKEKGYDYETETEIKS